MMERLSILYSNHVIIANHLWYDKLTRRSVRPEKCTAIINYPDPAIFSRKEPPARAGDEFVMCYPGTLSWHQGIDVAIEAVSLLRDEIPGLRLQLIGDGPERENLKRLIRERGLEERVSLSGLIPMEKVAEIMACIDLGIVPKRADSFGNEAFSTKVMEFMAMNVPVLASRTKIDEYYFSDRIVQFFESGNAQDLAEKIRFLIQHPDRRATLRSNSAEFIAQNNWDVRQHEYFGLVNRLLASHRLVVA
jgi:glycosyltransferase involved in cell wall biosynthesis